MLSSVKNIERDVQDRTDKGRELNSAIDADKKLLERWLVLQSGEKAQDQPMPNIGGMQPELGNIKST